MSSIRYGELFDAAWAKLKPNLALSAGLTLVYLIAAMTMSLVPVLGTWLASLLLPGYIISLIRITKNENLEYADFFWAFANMNRVIQLALMNFLVGLIVIVGFILLIIPGIYFSIALVLTNFNFVLRNEDAIESIKRSKALVSSHWWDVCLLTLLMGCVHVVGLMFFFVGVLITIPLNVLVFISLLEKLESFESSASQNNINSN